MQLNLKLPADFENEITVLYINIEVKFAVLKQYLEHVAFLFRAGYEKSVGKLDSLIII
jgi:hypothetical protein